MTKDQMRIQHIGMVIKKYREDRGWNRQELANYSKVARNTIANYENMLDGKGNPSIANLYALADAFGISVKEFFIDEE